MAVRRLADRLGLPLRTLVLAAHAKVLAALSGDREVVTGYAARSGGHELPPDSARADGGRPGCCARAGEPAVAEELRFQLDGLAGPRRELPDRRFHELFEQRVRMHPDAVAAVHGARAAPWSGWR